MIFFGHAEGLNFRNYGWGMDLGSVLKFHFEIIAISIIVLKVWR